MKQTLFAAFFCLILLGSPLLQAQEKPSFTRTEDVIYARKFGTALTLDVLQPVKPNGAGIIAVMSGGWFSSHDSIQAGNFALYLERGYTIFAVVHGSQPRFIIPEATQDMHRAVRFIRHHAARYNIDPNKLGVTGGSAGGHLSLTLGTQGSPGKPDAKDPIDRESSAVQAVACFFPPPDFLNYGQAGENAVGVGVLKNFKPAFGSRADTADERQKYGREISPIYFITSNLPPTLIIHGDADTLVPMQQAESFVKKAQDAGAKAKLIVKEGEAHGWRGMEKDATQLADWFDEHLRGVKPK